ncbi:transcriptional regulator ovo-like [Condylostylus longicornis]|uniref:transcriptional regulator ovo-like n=1 Tax=Condylostylus longicornis TaxID=2530218 RepID=UPI00244DA997|nr:transcriptional regulator ovo-like [Condylostylus longicornis]
MSAAAGHGRSSTNSANGSQSGSQSNSGSGGNCGQGINFNGQLGGGATGGSGGGLSGSGAGGGGMGGGRDGRSNYGPNSPPTGSLPPFYESLKSGNGSSLGQFNAASSNFLIASMANGGANSYLSMTNPNGQSDCGDTNGESNGGINNFTNNENSKFPLMSNNSAYGIVVKDELDLDYEGKLDMSSLSANLLSSAYNNYDMCNDSIMADLAANGVDPLQFTATLTFSGASENALLESLSDPVDLSSFLNRLPSDGSTPSPGNHDLDLTSTPSLTPDSVSITPVDTSSGYENFSENLIQQLQNSNRHCYEQPNHNHLRYNLPNGNNNKMYQESPPPPGYQQNREMMQLHQLQHQHQQPQHQTGHGPSSNSNSNSNNNNNNNNGNNNHNFSQHNTMLHGGNNHHHSNQNHSNSNGHSHNHHSSHTPAPPHPLMLNTAMMTVAQFHSNLNCSDNSNLSLPSPGGSSSSHLHNQLDIPPEAKPIIQSVSYISNSSSDSVTSFSCPTSYKTIILTDNGIIQNNGLNNFTNAQILINNGFEIQNDISNNTNILNPCSINNDGFIDIVDEFDLKIMQNCPNIHTSNKKTKQSLNKNRTKNRSIISTLTPMLQDTKLQMLKQRLGLAPEVQLEFVNGGHGIKNPLAIENIHGHRLRDDDKKSVIACEDDPNKFVCRICSKTFNLQRLLNRHMKCHSDIKRYLCTFCGKGFNDTFDLKRHTRTHTGVRPYKCNLCEKSFTQRCSLESHCLKVHGVQHQYGYKERRTKMYVCEECGHTTSEPEVHYIHLKELHPYSPALLKFYDKRHFKFTNSQFANNLLGQLPMSVRN